MSYPITTEQQKTLELVSSGKNVFISGDAGTGKTTLLRAIVYNAKP